MTEDLAAVALAGADIQRDDTSEGYFEAAARGVLAIRRCAACSTPAEPGTSRCPRCGSSSMDWCDASGVAVLVTWTRVPARAAVDGAPGVSSLLGIVELREGPWLHVPLLGVAPEQVRVGLPLRATFVTHVSGERSAAFTNAAEG